MVALDLWDHLGRPVNVGRVCHYHCGCDRRCPHPVRLVWVNGFLGCRTIAARTRDLILHTLHSFTIMYRLYFSFFFEDVHQFLGNFYHLYGIGESCGDPDPSVA